MNSNNQINQDKIFVHKNYFKYNNLNYNLYDVKNKDSNSINKDKGFFFKKKENKYSIFMKNVTRNSLSSNNLHISHSQNNILNFSTSKNNIKENSSKLIILPSILNSSIKDDSSKKIIPKRRIMKLKTEKIPENKMKLFQNEIKNAGNCGNINKKPINLDFLKDKTKYYELFFYNEKDYYKRLERAKRRKIEKKLKKKSNSVFKFDEYLNQQNIQLFQKNFEIERKL